MKLNSPFEKVLHAPYATKLWLKNNKINICNIVKKNQKIINPFLCLKRDRPGNGKLFIRGPAIFFFFPVS